MVITFDLLSGCSSECRVYSDERDEVASFFQGCASYPFQHVLIFTDSWLKYWQIFMEIHILEVSKKGGSSQQCSRVVL